MNAKQEKEEVFKNLCKTEDIEHALPLNSQYDAIHTHEPFT